MLASLQLVWEARKTDPRKDTNTHAHSTFNNEQPSPWFAARACFGEIFLNAVSNQTTESTRNGSGRVICS
jgi:hypothetical protein